MPFFALSWKSMIITVFSARYNMCTYSVELQRLFSILLDTQASTVHSSQSKLRSPQLEVLALLLQSSQPERKDDPLERAH